MSETQTTQQRIRSQIYYQLHGEFYSLETANAEVDRVSKAIAAEIDDLRERNAFLLTSAETAQAKLAECRAEVDRLREYIGNDQGAPE